MILMALFLLKYSPKNYVEKQIPTMIEVLLQQIGRVEAAIVGSVQLLQSLERGASWTVDLTDLANRDRSKKIDTKEIARLFIVSRHVARVITRFVMRWCTAPVCTCYGQRDGVYLTVVSGLLLWARGTRT